MSIFALCAASVSLVRRGKANSPIWMSWMVFIGCSRIATLTILPLFTTSWTCTGPYTVLPTLPVIVVSPAVKGPATLRNSPGTVVAEDDEDDEDPPPVPVVAATGTDGECDLNDNRATRPAMVPVTARTTRRISRIVSPQNSN